MSAPLRARLRIATLLIVAILVQTTLGSDLRVMGVAPDLMVLVTICAGLTGGAEAGAWVGFWAGLIADLFLTATPLGLSALTYCLIGAAVGALRTAVLPAARVITPAAALVGTAAAVLLWVALGDVLGQSQLLDAGRSWLIRVAAVEAGWATLLALPVGWLYARAARGSKGSELVGGDRTPVLLGDRLATR
jgi:rod shape-determining protein MreD